MKRTTDPDVLLLQAVADPNRLAILRQLSREGAVCACDFEDCCSVGQPTISHHLRSLRTAGWVQSERRGTWIYYSIRSEALERFRALAGELRAGIAVPASAFRASHVASAHVASAPAASATGSTAGALATPLELGPRD